MTITQRKTKSGVTRYRAVVRIQRSGYPNYTASRTFSTEALAKAWRKSELLKFEVNPDLLHGAKPSITIKHAIDRYLSEIGDSFGRTVRAGLTLMQRLPIAQVQLDQLQKSDIAAHVTLRESGSPAHGINPVQPSTINFDLQQLRPVLTYAIDVWGLDANLQAFDDAKRGLMRARRIKAGNKRDRLTTADELTQTTNYFKTSFERGLSHYPVHLIMWLAIYTTRRRSELGRLLLSEYDGESVLVRDLKNPRGSAGNHKRLIVDPPAARLIDLLLQPEYRLPMLKSKDADPRLILPVNMRSVSHHFGQVLKSLGIEDLHWHDLRHEGITRLAEQGMTIPQMQQRSGHDSWGSLQRYSNVRPRPKVIELTDLIDLGD